MPEIHTILLLVEFLYNILNNIYFNSVFFYAIPCESILRGVQQS